jgi:hypothetical protein
MAWGKSHSALREGFRALRAHAYAWSSPLEDGKRRFYAVLRASVAAGL